MNVKSLSLNKNLSLYAQAGLVIAASMILALAANVKIPTMPIPFTLQTLAVALIGASLGSRMGVLAVVTYIAQGLSGLPVFAGVSFGLAYLVSPSFGYILSFIISIALIGYVARRNTLVLCVGIVSAFQINLLGGSLWLSAFLGSISAGFTLGYIPFAVIELFKACAAITIILAARRILRK